MEWLAYSTHWPRPPTHILGQSFDVSQVVGQLGKDLFGPRLHRVDEVFDVDHGLGHQLDEVLGCGANLFERTDEGRWHDANVPFGIPHWPGESQKGDVRDKHCPAVDIEQFRDEEVHEDAERDPVDEAAQRQNKNKAREHGFDRVDGGSVVEVEAVTQEGDAEREEQVKERHRGDLVTLWVVDWW